MNDLPKGFRSLHWHWGNRKIVPTPVDQPGRIWVKCTDIKLVKWADIEQVWLTDIKPQQNKKCKPYISRLMQERLNSNANALELRLSCTNPSIYIQFLGYTLPVPIFHNINTIYIYQLHQWGQQYHNITVFRNRNPWHIHWNFINNKAFRERQHPSAPRSVNE